MSEFQSIYDTSGGQCASQIVISGESYRRSLTLNHVGWAHQSLEAVALWENQQKFATGGVINPPIVYPLGVR